MCIRDRVSMVHLVVIYSCETWILSESDKKQLRRIGRKMLRGIFVTIKKGDTWRIRTSEELKAVIEGKNIVTQSNQFKSWHIRQEPKKKQYSKNAN